MAVDLDARLLFSGFHVCDSDVAEIWNMLQVEADRLAHEGFERHFIDGGAGRVDVAISIDVSADVIQHCNKVGLEGHGISRHAEIGRLGALVAHVQRDYGPLE